MTRPLTWLSLLAALAAVALALRPRPAAPGDPVGEPTATVPVPPTEVTLGEEVCRDAGYLCAGLVDRDEPRVLRWDAMRISLTVVVPLPPHEDPARAVELQRAAVRGVRAWHEQPFPLRVEMTAPETGADLVVTWRESLPGSELGHVSSRWTRDGGTMTVDVMEFLLVTRHPLDGARPLDGAEVELAAAHEMGHALGLPHSDSPRDIMYPSNTAGRMSVDDYRTMEALYRLPNGALIHLPAAGRRGGRRGSSPRKGGRRPRGGAARPGARRCRRGGARDD
jgi:hypothetical protein